jgi:heat shock protein HtpX
MERISFYDQIAANKRKSYFLMFLIFLVFLLLGYAISKVYTAMSFFSIMILAIIISIFYLMISYYNSDKIALASVNAKPANRNECRQYYDSVEGLTIASGLPMPKLYVMQNEQINAFATGRDPKNAVVCVTTGALQKLNKQELEGVLSHEMSHIANFDIRFMTLVAVMVGMIAIISEIFLRSMWFKSSDRDSKGSAIFLIIGLVLAILAPIVVQLVQLSISRKREFTADATAVKFTRTPTGLIGALKKIKNDKPMKVSGAMKSLFMSDPARSKIQNLFSTHPDINERIKILEKM